MNFLAHLTLAGTEDASRIGNLLGDFEKGTPESLYQRLPPEIVPGILMHRQIDRFTDSHAIFHETKSLLAPERRRFAGIVIDIFFDHFLSKHWSTYHPGTVTGFISEIYDLLDKHPTWLGSELGPLVPRLKKENWLASYSDFEGLEKTLQRIASRSSRFDPMKEGIDDLKKNYPAFESAFLQFYPELRQYAAKLLDQKTRKSPSFP